MIPQRRRHGSTMTPQSGIGRSWLGSSAAFVLFTCVQVGAEDLAEMHQQAVAAMHAGNYAEAYCIWRPQAEAGNAAAQYNLGWIYHNGYGVVIDDERARFWWEQAAEQGHSDSQFALGMLYYHGERKVERDPARAARYFLQSVRTGNVDAHAMLRTLIDEHDDALRDLSRDLLKYDWQVLGGALEVSVDRANVRAAPDESAKVLMVLRRGRPLVELNRRDDWVRVGVAGDASLGWIHSSLVRQRDVSARE